jgi:hypothetical protein
MSAEVEVQRAIFEKLATLVMPGFALFIPSGSTSLITADGFTFGIASPRTVPVVDVAPQSADGGSATPFPYVAIGTIVLGQFDTARENGFDFAARIHTRSRTTSMMECKTVQGQIYALLHNAALSVVGANFILMQRETSDCLRAQDGTFHGVCEYRGLIETA